MLGKEHYKEYYKEYCKRNKERIKERNRVYYQNHRNEKKEYQKEYYTRNKERCKKYSREREFIRKYKLNINQIEEMLAKQNYKCEICGSSLLKIRRGIDHNPHNRTN